MGRKFHGPAVASPLSAGTLELQPKETAPPTITESEAWQFTVAATGWMAGFRWHE